MDNDEESYGASLARRSPIPMGAAPGQMSRRWVSSRITHGIGYAVRVQPHRRLVTGPAGLRWCSRPPGCSPADVWR
jgi:hypothetical protein